MCINVISLKAQKIDINSKGILKKQADTTKIKKYVWKNNKKVKEELIKLTKGEGKDFVKGDNYGGGGISKNFGFLQPINIPSKYSKVVKLYVMYPNDPNHFYHCSGAMVDENFVMTAAHCIYDNKLGGKASKIYVVPSVNKTTKNPLRGVDPERYTYGYARVVSSMALKVINKYKKGEELRWDLGVMKTKRPIGGVTGYYGFAYSSKDSYYKNKKFTVRGYPSEDKYYSGDVMWEWSGTFDWVNEFQMWHRRDDKHLGGMSGANAQHDTGDPYGKMVHAVYTHWSNDITENWSGYSRIDNDKFREVRNYIRNNTYDKDIAPLDVSVKTNNVKRGGSFDLSFILSNVGLEAWSSSVNVEVFLSSESGIKYKIEDISLFVSEDSPNLYIESNGGGKVIVSDVSVPLDAPTGDLEVKVSLDASDDFRSNNITNGWDNGQLNVKSRPPDISLSKQKISFSYSSGKKSFRINNEGGKKIDWDITSIPDWISSVNPSSGTGEKKVTINAEENNSVSSRSNSITIDGNNGGGSESLTVTQKGHPSITVTRPAKDIKWKIGSVQSVKWKSDNLKGKPIDIALIMYENGERDASIEQFSNIDNDGVQPWSLPEDESYADDDKRYKIKVAAADGSASDKSPFFDIIEPPKLTVSDESLSFPADKETKTINIKNAGGGTLDWQIKGSASWFSVQPGEGTVEPDEEEDEVEITAEKNGDTSSRSDKFEVDAGDAGSEKITVEQAGTKPRITGTVRYPQSSGDAVPIEGAKVVAKNESGEVAAGGKTDARGNYSLKVTDGNTYRMTVASVPGKPQRVNLGDALDVQSYFLTASGLSGFQQTLADVDENGTAETPDAFEIESHVVSKDHSFEAGSFYSDSKEVSVSGGGETADLRVAAYGDANLNGRFGSGGSSAIALSRTGSAQGVAASTTTAGQSPVVVVPGSAFEVPVRADGSARLGAYQLGFEYPARQVRFEGAKAPSSEVRARAQGGTVRLAWFDRSGGKDPISLEKGEVLVRLKFRASESTGQGGAFRLEAASGKLFDPEGEPLAGAGLQVPKVRFEGRPGRFAVRGNAPNPFRRQTALSVDMPKGGTVTVEVYNTLGQKVKQVREQVSAGSGQKIEIDGTGLKSGVYLYRVRARVGSKTAEGTGRMTVTR